VSNGGGEYHLEKESINWSSGGGGYHLMGRVSFSEEWYHLEEEGESIIWRKRVSWRVA
jgi:hypothetical protein